MNNYIFFLNFGYAEDSLVGYLSFESVYTYGSAKEAFQDLAKYLKECYQANEPGTHLQPCCVETASKISNPRFCAACGRPISKTTEFDEEAFQDSFLMVLPRSTLSDFPITYNEDDRWLLFNPSEENAGKVVYVHEAEKCILAALGYCLNENTFKALFEEEKTRYGFYG